MAADTEILPDLFAYFASALSARAPQLREEYLNAEPFPHIVIDDLLPNRTALEILKRFPGPEFPGFLQPDFEDRQLLKLGRIQDSSFFGVDPWLREQLFTFNSMAFLNFLEQLTGVMGLIPDPHFEGGAFHQSLPDGKLDVHADFSVDTRRSLCRRVNVLIYFNPNWLSDYGGFLELWDKEMTGPVKTISPDMNRCVIFPTSRTSFHGHPVPVACPEGMTRKSFGLYYYQADPQAHDPEFGHGTLWQDLPSES